MRIATSGRRRPTSRENKGLLTSGTGVIKTRFREPKSYLLIYLDNKVIVAERTTSPGSEGMDIHSPGCGGVALPAQRVGVGTRSTLKAGFIFTRSLKGIARES